MTYPEDELPFDEDNDSELYSEDCFNENFKNGNEDDLKLSSTYVCEEYNADPKAFDVKRDSVYKFDDVHYCTYEKYEKWTLVDMKKNVTYKVFEDEKELAAFVKTDVVARAYKRIIMDRIVGFNSERLCDYDVERSMEIEEICFRKGCLKVYPLHIDGLWMDDEVDRFPIHWLIENVTKEEEDKLCCELYKAGLHGKTIDERYEAASMPF